MRRARFSVLLCVSTAACAARATDAASRTNVPPPAATVEIGDAGGGPATSPPPDAGSAAEPERERERDLRLLDDAPCVVRDGHIRLLSPIELRVEGTTYARIVDAVESITLAARGRSATLAITTAEAELLGEDAVSAVRVRPRGRELREGYLGIYGAQIEDTEDGDATLDLELPTSVRPVAPPKRKYACSELTFEEIDFKLPAGKVVTLDGNGSPLRASIGGRVVATVDGDTVDEIERRGRMVRISIRHFGKQGPSSVVVGWVDASIIKLGPAYGTGGGGQGAGVMRSLPQCTHEVPIFVRVKEHVVRVGRVKPGVALRIREDADRGEREEVDLQLGVPGIRASSAAKPFVRRKDFADCPRVSLRM